MSGQGIDYPVLIGRNHDQGIGAVLLFPPDKLHLLIRIQFFIQGKKADVGVKLQRRLIHAFPEASVIVVAGVFDDDGNLVDLFFRLPDDQIRRTHEKQDCQKYHIQKKCCFPPFSYHVPSFSMVSVYCWAGRRIVMTVPSSGSDWMERP